MVIPGNYFAAGLKIINVLFMKRSITTLIKSRKYYFAGLLILLIFGSITVLFFGNADHGIHTAHGFLLNVFFINYTFMGDAVFMIGLVAVVTFYLKRKKEGTALFIAFLFTELSIQVIKNLLNITNGFTLYFEEGQTIFNPVAGFGGINDSFPSGHTALAFATVTVIILRLKKSYWQILLLLAAVLLGYSRIYLARNILPDILIAAVLGSLSGIFSVYLVYNRFKITDSARNLFKSRFQDPLPQNVIQSV